MIKCKAIEEFTLKDFDKLKNIKRANVKVYGKIFINDEFECDKKMVKYLLGENDLKKEVAKIIEIIPTEDKEK